MSDDFEDDLRLAHAIADAADAVTMDRFQAIDLRIETKPDLSPVTDADRAVEQLVRAHVTEARPGDAIVGEEYGAEGTGPRRWVVDPIDGTKNFVRGVPIWGTLIALTLNRGDGQVPVVGVVSAPALGRRWWASEGAGAYVRAPGVSKARLGVSKVSELGDASFGYSSTAMWKERDMLGRFMELTAACWRSRGFGDFWPHMMVAEGSLDIAAEAELSLWDVAASAVIVREAGGTLTNLEGQQAPLGGDVAISNGLLHSELLRYLGT